MEQTTRSKPDLIDEIMKGSTKNKSWSPAETRTYKAKLENMDQDNLQKMYATFSSFDKEAAADQVLSGRGETMSMSDIKKLIIDIVENKTKNFEGLLNSKVAGVETQILDIINKNTRTVTVKLNDGSVKNLGIQHEKFPSLLKLAAARTISGPLNIWLTGPAGSGKTTAAQNTAKALGLEFYFNGAVDTEYKLTGFIDAQGRMIKKAFRQAYEKGGVYLFDEVDASLPGALLAFNAALANGYADFPDGQVTRHPDCVIIAAANTWGLGANSDYVGRNRLDAAFLDRFVQLSWSYDEALENNLATCKPWAKFVQTVRKNASRNGVKVVISPRATYHGSALLETGQFTLDEIIDMTLKKGLSDDQWNIIKGTTIELVRDLEEFKKVLEIRMEDKSMNTVENNLNDETRNDATNDLKVKASIKKKVA